LRRLAASRHALQGTFFGGRDPGPLVSAAASGDTHRRGQLVQILSFEGGDRLVYKPRPVLPECCFFDAVAWLNARGLDPELKTVRVRDEGSHGWMEFAASLPCETEDEVARFFRRQGAQLALVYVLGGNDFHFENVIAHGEYPVLVDLETLFQVPLVPADMDGATAKAWVALQSSVLGTLLLPRPLAMAKDSDGVVDVSALGDSEGQLTPFPVPVWRGGGTDLVRLAYERRDMPSRPSLPQQGNTPALASHYVDQVVAGFEAAYELIHRQRNALLADDGPLGAASGAPVRNVFRATARYALLLDASFHPRFLSDAIAA